MFMQWLGLDLLTKKGKRDNEAAEESETVCAGCGRAGRVTRPGPPVTLLPPDTRANNRLHSAHITHNSPHTHGGCVACDMCHV